MDNTELYCVVTERHKSGLSSALGEIRTRDLSITSSTFTTRLPSHASTAYNTYTKHTKKSHLSDIT